MAKIKKILSPREQIIAVRKKLGHVTLERKARYWLDTKSPRLNQVLGSRTRGLAYGKMYEFSGFESHGKTLLASFIGGLAQDDGALLAWVDVENAWDEMWATAQGIDPEKVALFQSEIGKFKKEDKVNRLQTAQELCIEVEEWMKQRFDENPDVKIFVVVDSVTAFLVDEEGKAGVTNQNMKTKIGLATFLSQLLRRWTGYAKNYNAAIIFINQVRTSPGIKFGNPEYTPGGNALRFYCSIRARIKRIKAGRLLQDGKIIGLQAEIKNIKNKAGEGSREGFSCGFKAFFNKCEWTFLSEKQVKKLKAFKEK